MLIYVVKQGDTIYQIANRFGLDWKKIIEDNKLTHPNELVVGQTIVILADEVNYTIVRGDRLTTIANMFGVSVADVLRANPELALNSVLQIGQQITIPLPDVRLGSMEANGYAFPHIPSEVLNATLPHLTYLSPFSYEVRPGGSLVPIIDEALIEQANMQNVEGLMIITNIDNGGGFSGELTNELFASDQAQQNLINNVLATIREKGYYGVGVDFEYIFPEDRENFNEFLRRLTDVMHQNGYIVTVAVAPKTSDDMQGVLYEAHDYKTIGEIADHVVIMTYEWGYTYGEPMAVSPVNRVKEVLDYAVTVIPRNKILMGVPNYGYDWTLPWQQGTAARVVSNVGAVDLARERGAFIMYDPVAQAPYFNYYDDQAKQHVVWFEDARSIDAKLRLVNQYGLLGVSYWTINRFFPQNWLVQDALYDIIKLR